MQVRIEYASGRRVVWDTTYLNHEGRLQASASRDELDYSNLSEGVFLYRNYVNTKGISGDVIQEGEPIVVVSPGEYYDVLFVIENGEVVLESDGNGWLVRPGDGDVEE